MLLRDLDLLKALAEDNLVSVNIIYYIVVRRNTACNRTKNSNHKTRLETVKALSENEIPVVALLNASKIKSFVV